MGKKIAGWIMFIIGLGGLGFFITSMVVKGEVIVYAVWGIIAVLLWTITSLRMALSKPKT